MPSQTIATFKMAPKPKEKRLVRKRIRPTTEQPPDTSTPENPGWVEVFRDENGIYEIRRADKWAGFSLGIIQSADPNVMVLREDVIELATEINPVKYRIVKWNSDFNGHFLLGERISPT